MESTILGKIYSYGKTSKTARNDIRERFARVAKKSVDREPDKVPELVDFAVKLFSKAHLLRAASRSGLEVLSSWTKPEIVKECLRKGWSPESEEEALAVWTDSSDGKLEIKDGDSAEDDSDKVEKKFLEFKKPVKRSRSAWGSDGEECGDETDFPAGTDGLEEQARSVTNVFIQKKASAVGDASSDSVPAKRLKIDGADSEKGYGGERAFNNEALHRDQVGKVLPVLEELLSSLKSSSREKPGSLGKSRSVSFSGPVSFSHADSAGASSGVSNRDWGDHGSDTGLSGGENDEKYGEVQTGRRDTENAFLLAVNSMAEAAKQQVKLSRALVEAQNKEQSDTNFEGCLPPSIIKKAKKGQFISILDVFDIEISKLRLESKGFSVKLYRKPASLDNVDMEDFCLAMSKIGSLYAEYGQINLCTQILALLGSVYKLTATHQRLSVMKAIERLRSFTTKPDVTWTFDSVFTGDFRSLLRPLNLSGPPKKTFSFQPGKVNFEGKLKDGSQHVKATKGPRGQCAYWADGRACPFGASCKFQHSCSACGNVATHSPNACKLRGIKFQNLGSQSFDGQPKVKWPKQRI